MTIGSYRSDYSALGMSREAQELDHRISACAAAAEESAEFKQRLKALDHFMRSAKDANFLLEDSPYLRFTPFHNAIRLPYGAEAHKQPKAPGLAHGLADRKAAAIFRVLSNFAHDAIEEGTLDAAAYGKCLTRVSTLKHSILGDAVNYGNVALIKQVFGEVRAHLSREAYAELLATSNNAGFSLLHTALDRMDRKIETVFKEVHFNMKLRSYAALLMQTTADSAGGCNLLHIATRNRPQDQPDPFILEFLLDELKRGFSGKFYRDNLKTLLDQPNSEGMEPMMGLKPEWMKRIFDCKFNYDNGAPMVKGKAEHSFVARTGELPKATRFR